MTNTNPTAQDFIDAQAKIDKDAVLNRYHNDALFKYRVDSSAMLAISNAGKPVGPGRRTDFRLGAMFALALDEAMNPPGSDRS